MGDNVVTMTQLSYIFENSEGMSNAFSDKIFMTLLKLQTTSTNTKKENRFRYDIHDNTPFVCVIAIVMGILKVNF